jgi:hypothetical protein
MYKNILYWVNTKYGCGGVVVGDSGIINETCPLYRWMKRKSFKEVIRGLKKSKKLLNCRIALEEYDPF